MLKIKTQGTARYYLEAGHKLCRPLTEAELGKIIPGFKELNKKAREKRFRKYVEKAQIVDCGHIPEDLPNTCPSGVQTAGGGHPPGRSSKQGLRPCWRWVPCSQRRPQGGICWPICLPACGVPS